MRKPLQLRYLPKSFEVVAREWHSLPLERWKPVHASDVITNLEREIFPDLGYMPLADIDKPLLLNLAQDGPGRGLPF